MPSTNRFVVRIAGKATSKKVRWSGVRSFPEWPAIACNQRIGARTTGWETKAIHERQASG
jgi:hypothetical protein